MGLLRASLTSLDDGATKTNVNRQELQIDIDLSQDDLLHSRYRGGSSSAILLKDFPQAATLCWNTNTTLGPHRDPTPLTA